MIARDSRYSRSAGDEATAYDFHGLGLSTPTEPWLEASLGSRLRRFPRRDGGHVDVAFQVQMLRRDQQHALKQLAGETRPVYQPAVGEVMYAPREDLLSMSDGERIWTLCDPTSGMVRVSVQELSEADLWLISHAMFTLPLMECLKRRGYYSLHAAGLSVGDGGLLLAGGSGAGKSTTALALLRAGFPFLGDDMLFLARKDDGLRVLAFPDEIDVADGTVQLFPELRFLLEAPHSPGWPKRRLLPEWVYQVRFVWECRPSALIFPRVAHTARSVLRPMSKDEALLELAPNVLLTEAHSSQAHLSILGQLVRETACYRLETGRDLEALPDLLGKLVA